MKLLYVNFWQRAGSLFTVIPLPKMLHFFTFAAAFLELKSSVPTKQRKWQRKNKILVFVPPAARPLLLIKAIVTSIMPPSLECNPVGGGFIECRGIIAWSRVTT
jgi:hypothetical protein